MAVFQRLENKVASEKISSSVCSAHGSRDRASAMTEQKKEEKKEVAVDLECDDEFEEFGNEGESRAPEPNPGSRERPDISPNLTLARSRVLTVPRRLHSSAQSGEPRRRTPRM